MSEPESHAAPPDAGGHQGEATRPGDVGQVTPEDPQGGGPARRQDPPLHRDTTAARDAAGPLLARTVLWIALSGVLILGVGFCWFAGGL